MTNTRLLRSWSWHRIAYELIFEPAKICRNRNLSDPPPTPPVCAPAEMTGVWQSSASSFQRCGAPRAIHKAAKLSWKWTVHLHDNLVVRLSEWKPWPFEADWFFLAEMAGNLWHFPQLSNWITMTQGYPRPKGHMGHDPRLWYGTVSRNGPPKRVPSMPAPPGTVGCWSSSPGVGVWPLPPPCSWSPGLRRETSMTSLGHGMSWIWGVS